MLSPGAILRSLTGELATVVSVDACAELLIPQPSGGELLWTWPRRSTERALRTLGYQHVGVEDVDVLAERVRLARAEARNRRAA